MSKSPPATLAEALSWAACFVWREPKKKKQKAEKKEGTLMWESFKRKGPGYFFLELQALLSKKKKKKSAFSGA